MIQKGRRKIKSVFAMLAAVLLFMQCLTFPSSALEDWPTECYVLSEGACLMDADSGVTLYSRNADSAYYPASITKVLTALIVIENCDNLSEMVSFSYDAVHIEEQNSTIIGASEGDKLSVLDCLYCLLFQSANEVANALAEHVGAKHPELKEKGETDLNVFVKLMNAKALELGCTGSHFNNPSGLTDADHYTTPHDMCLIMTAAIGNGTFLDIESHTYWKHAPIRRYPDADDPWNTVYMKHLMLRKNSNQYYEGCIAGKTGYTVTAGNTLVTACRRDGMTLVCCVMNAHANHYNDTARLFDFGFSNFRSVPVADYDRTNELVQKDFKVAGVPVLDSLTLAIDSDTKVTLPKGGDISEVEKEFSVCEGSADETLAVVDYYYGTRKCGQAPMRVVPLGGLSEVGEASGDPMFYKIAGIEPETETAGESGTAAENGQEEETGSAPEGGTGETGESADRDTSGETDGSAEEAETSAGADAVPETEEERKESSGRAVKILCFSVLGIVLLLGGFTVFRYRAEVNEEKRRHARRLERMKKVSDLSGTQQISMDLEVRKKMEQKIPVRRKASGTRKQQKNGISGPRNRKR